MANMWKLDADGQALLEKASQVASDVIGPAAAAIDAEGKFPKEGIEALRAAGLLRVVSGKDSGGHGHGLRASVAVAERIARECPSTAMIWIMHNASAAVVEKCGTAEMKKEIAKDGKLATLAFSEFGSRSHFWIPVSTAEKTSKGVKLNAAKQLITSAGVCDFYVWSSKPVFAPGLSSLWWVPSNAPGLTVPKPYDGMGLRGNVSAPISAKDVLIPETNRLGEDGKGFDVMMGVVMPFFSIQNCAVSVGLMEGALARAIAHVTNSKYSYDGSPIAALPQVRGHLAKARVKVDMLRGLLLDALDAVETNREDAMLRVLQAKVAGAETSLEVTDLAMRVCGGAAYRKDIGLDRYFRDSRAATVMAPVSDALYDFIGKAVCGMPLF